ncbi:MAG: rhomboid family intramembrane serine protease [Planctomycetota bacterium]|nr:rhomboid family intramembrane serine protease [Planctomycetota bacterium]
MPAITPFVKRLMVINAIVFLLMVPLSPNGDSMHALVRWMGVTPNMWFLEAPFFPFWQLASYGFMHDTSSLQHLLFNMLGLYFFGTMVERAVGAKRFAIAYFGAMFAGGLAHVITGWFGHGSIPALGASGAVLGVLLMAAVMQPNARVIFIIFPMTLKTLVMIVVGMDAFALLVAFRDGGSDGVAHWVHLGGAAFGYFWARKGLIHVDWSDRWQRKRQVVHQAKEQDAALHMDELLIKIQKEGISSLSDKERAFLKKMSERGK